MGKSGFERPLSSSIEENQCPSPALQQSLDLMQSTSRGRQSSLRQEPTVLAFDLDDPFVALSTGATISSARPIAPGRGIAGEVSGSQPNTRSSGKSVTPMEGKKVPSSREETGIDKSGLTGEELLIGDLGRQAEGIFDRIDTNRDGRLGSAELGRAVEDHQYFGLNAQAVAALYRNRAEISRLSNDQFFVETDISRQDLASFERIGAKDPQGITQSELQLSFRVGYSISRTLEGQRNGSDQLYGSSNVPNPFAIEQGMIGNCYFLASISALADSDPDAIKNMIRDNHDGTYTVTFPGDRLHPITVDAPTEAEGGLYQQASENGIWPNILETAYGEYRQRHRIVRQGYTSTEGADGGGNPSEVLNLLTGTSNSRNVWTMTPDFLPWVESPRAALTRAFSEHRAVTASTLPNPRSGPGSDRTPGGFVRQHAYAVIGWEPDGPDGGTITLRNPWGSNEGEGKLGVSTLSMDEFQRNFRRLSVQGRRISWTFIG